MNHGKFVISLDFELIWGVLDRTSLSAYLKNIEGVQQVIPKLLHTFNDFDVNATFSTVGLLFLNDQAAFNHHIPEQIPQYNNKRLSPFEVKDEERLEFLANPQYCYAPHLVHEIQKYPKQEIGTHTYCHYYCLESKQTVDQFRIDLKKAIEVAQQFDIEITSLVFPRNQFKDEYLSVCKELGIICVRGNESSWLYEARNKSNESQFRRALRLIDAYFNISGHHCYTDQNLKNGHLINIPSSRFLRPHSTKLKAFDLLRLARIKSGMTHAAKNNKTYHLWWHPHNFGIYQDANFSFLKKILEHYRVLHDRYNFASYTMSDLAKRLLN